MLMMVFSREKALHTLYLWENIFGQIDIKKEKKDLIFVFLMLSKQCIYRIHIALSKIILTFLDIIQTFCM